MIEKFAVKSYNRGELIQIGEEIGRQNKDDILQPSTKNTPRMADELALISIYDTHMELIRKSIGRAWHVLQKDPKYGKLYRDPPKFIYRKGKSIGNSLIRSDIREHKPNLLSD